MKKWLVGGVLALLLIAAGVGFLRWRAAMAPVTRTQYAARLHEHILSAQLERWPGAADGWDSLTREMANIREARQSLGTQAEILRGFDISGSDDTESLASAVGDAGAAGVFETAARIAGIQAAARPFDELKPEDMLVGVMFDELSEVMFLLRAEMARAFIAAQHDPPDTSERLAALDESLALAELLSW